MPISFAFGGDILLDRGVYLESKIPRFWNKKIKVLQNELKGIDISWANLECPIEVSQNGRPQKPMNKVSPYAFSCKAELLSAIRSIGIKNLSIRNNHGLDLDTNGWSHTQRVLLNSGFYARGFNQYQNFGVDTLTFKNQSFLAYSSCLLSEPKPICSENTDVLLSQIEKDHSEKPHWPQILFVHWGIEYQKQPTFLQENLAEKLSKAGIKLIVGHHPHTWQPIVKRNHTLIAYSIGNLLFDQKGDNHFFKVMWDEKSETFLEKK
jgi:hypothetical protein